MLKQIPSAAASGNVMYTCGWCNTHFQTWQSQCVSCGGPMPPLPGMALSAEPPPAPRELPRGFEAKQKWLGNAPAIVGAIFLLVGIIQFIVFILVLPFVAPLPLLFIIIGWFVMSHGRRQAQKLLNAFRNGRPVKGTISEVFQDTSIKVNGRCPWRIVYSFEANGQNHEGFARTFDASARERQPGQPIWVLVNDNDPTENTVYPPVK